MSSKVFALFIALSCCLMPPADCAARAAGGKDLGPQEFGAGLKRYERGGKPPERAKDSKEAEGGNPPRQRRLS